VESIPKKKKKIFFVTVKPYLTGTVAHRAVHCEILVLVNQQRC